MSLKEEKRAMDHPAYDDALRRATNRAAVGCESVVCFDGKAIFVTTQGACPEYATVICVAQRWDDQTVQLRFAGARSEWVKL